MTGGNAGDRRPCPHEAFEGDSEGALSGLGKFSIVGCDELIAVTTEQVLLRVASDPF